MVYVYASCICKHFNEHLTLLVTVLLVRTLFACLALSLDLVFCLPFVYIVKFTCLVNYHCLVCVFKFLSVQFEFEGYCLNLMFAICG